MFIVVWTGVSQQFLLHLDVGARTAKHGRIGVTERMPPDLPDASAKRRWLQLSLEDGFLPARKAFMVGENPVPCCIPGTPLVQFLQTHRESRIKWEGP